MAIGEQQLQTWTGIGSIQQSSATYHSIKNVIEHKDATLCVAERRFVPSGFILQ